MARREADEVPVHPGPTLKELLVANKSYMRFRGRGERVSLMSCLNMHWRTLDMVSSISEAPVAERAQLTKRVHGFIGDMLELLLGKRGAHTAPLILVNEAVLVPLILFDDKETLVKELSKMRESLELDFDESTNGK